MSYKENPYMGPWMNAPGTTLPWYSVPGAEDFPYYQPGIAPEMAGAMAYPNVYPEIYYKLQPHIMRACDEMENYGLMPSEEMIEYKCEQIHENVCSAHPELAEYAREYEIKAEDTADPTAEFVFNPIIEPFGRRNWRRPRPRGLFGDLVRILLLSELFGRRRRRGYY